jgi:glycosyltransferase involved in cell wall biosynthesis
MAVIVSVVWYKVFPALYGGQKGIAEFNERLSRHHTLFCLCSHDNDTAEVPYPALPLLKGGRKGFILPSNWTAVIRTIRQTGATHLLIEHPYFGLAGLFARMLTGVKLVVHAHNIESKVFRDNGRWWWRAVGLLERTVYRRADLVLFKTEADRGYAVGCWKVDRGRTQIVPFGISRRSNPTMHDKSEAAERIRMRLGLPEDRAILFFCGTLDYEPNARALRWMVGELLPELRRRGRARFQLLATGRVRKPAFGWVLDLKDPDYTYIDEVDDVSDFMTGSDLFVNPVDSGGGIKVKNLEALSYGLTVVTTPHSAVGIDAKSTGGKLVVVENRDAGGFASAVEENLRRGRPTPESFFADWHWDRIAADAAARIGSC